MNALARLTTRRPRLVLLLALLFVVDAVLLGSGVADRLRAGQGTENPAAESARAAELLDARFPASRPNFVLLVSSPRGVEDRGVARQGVELAERLAAEPGVTGVASYWQTGERSLKAEAGGHALIVARLAGDEETANRTGQQLSPSYRGAHGDLEVKVGGVTAILSDVERTIAEDLTTSELIALPLTLLILVLVFGSAVAALLPLLVGIVAIIGTNAVLWLIGGVTDVSVFAQNLTTALGLGLAIDYALLMVRRFRDELAGGAAPADAVTAMLRTSGRTVLFSALTVSAALSAMLVFPLYFLRSFAYAGVSVVLLAAAAALVVLPAALVLLGHRVNALNLRRSLGKKALWQGGSGWQRLTSVVTRRAPLFAFGSVAVLIVLGLPFLRVQCGMADDRQLPVAAESRVVQQTIRDHFDSSATGVIDVVVQGVHTDAARTDLAAYATRLSTVDGVDEVRTPVGTFADGRGTAPRTVADATREVDGIGYLQVVPDRGIEDISPRSQDLVRTVRSMPSPFTTMVAGRAAALVDTQQAIADRLGLAIAVIVLVTLLLVFLLTGSVLIPLQAVLLNALSLTAMFGAVVWVFQDGRLSGLLGFTPAGFIDTALPVLMFCMAFGLSMDYGVFLLSRTKEEYDRTGDHRKAVALGVQRTGGIITAAALILAVVLISIGISRITNTMMLGWGVAIAVMVDATVVRCLLVPAVMTMTGRATWWAPAPLRRFHQRFGLREEPAAPAPVRTPQRVSRVPLVLLAAGLTAVAVLAPASARPTRPETGAAQPLDRLAAATAQRLRAEKIVDVPVRFTVRNINRTKAPCHTDGKTYEVRGHLTAPADLLDHPQQTVTLYQHGVASGEWYWRLDVPGYHHAEEMARRGHASVTIDRLGYPGSDRPNGLDICLGGQADMTHQIVEQLRAGGYQADGRAQPPAFRAVTLAGHDNGAEIAEIAAYSFGDVAGVVVMSWVDRGTTERYDARFLSALSACFRGGPAKNPGGPSGYVHFDPGPREFLAGNFHDTDPAVLGVADRLRNRHPCGDLAAQLESNVVSLRHLHEITVPVLVVSGENDTRIQGAASQRALFGGATEFVLVPGAGHYTGLERGAPQVHDRLAGWLDRTAAHS